MSANIERTGCRIICRPMKNEMMEQTEYVPNNLYVIRIQLDLMIKYRWYYWNMFHFTIQIRIIQFILQKIPDLISFPENSNLLMITNVYPFNIKFMHFKWLKTRVAGINNIGRITRWARCKWHFHQTARSAVTVQPRRIISHSKCLLKYCVIWNGDEYKVHAVFSIWKRPKTGSVGKYAMIYWSRRRRNDIWNGPPVRINE